MQRTVDPFRRRIIIRFNLITLGERKLLPETVRIKCQLTPLIPDQTVKALFFTVPPVSE